MRLSGLIVAMAAICTAASALPLTFSVDLRFEGYSWETDDQGGYPPAGGPGVAGNVLYAVGQVLKVLDGTGAVTIADPADYGMEATFYLHDLVSQGATPYAQNTWWTDYVGGSIEIYSDNTPDYQPATGPGTYSGVTDGDLALSADVISFYTVFNSVTQVGFYGGTFQVTGGYAAPYFIGNLGLTGASTALPGAIPPRWTYDHRIKGDLRGEVVPEPGTLLMVVSGMLGSVCVAARRRR